MLREPDQELAPQAPMASSWERSDELARTLAGLQEGRRPDRLAELDRILRPRLRAYFNAHGTPGGDADDLVQACLVRVYRSIDGLRDMSRFLPWLFTIARNVRFSHLARRQRDAAGSPLTDPVATDAPDPEREAMARERLRRAQSAIEQLPAQQRQCLLLQVREGLSYEDIGATLTLSPFTVRNHIATARRTLRAALGEEAS